MKIIDVASANGFVQWALISESIDVAILKACDGHCEDESNDTNYTDTRIRADRYNVPIEAVYGWWYPPRVDQTIKSMANVLHKLASGSKMVLDLELRGGWVWKPGYKQNVIDHLNALDQLGGIPTIAYLGADMLNNFINTDGTFPDWITKRPIWWAQYPNRKVPFPDQWNLNNYAFSAPNNIPEKFTGKIWRWQFNANGVIVGINGNSVDLNTDNIQNIPQIPAPTPPSPIYPSYKTIYAVNVRSANSSTSDKLGVLPAGTTVYIDTYIPNEYSHFQPTTGFLTGGYIYTSYIKPT